APRAAAAALTPFVDIAAVLAMQARALAMAVPEAARHPPLAPTPALTDWSLGALVLAVFVAASALTPWRIWATAALAWMVEIWLHRATRSHPGALLASGLVLVVAAAVASW